MDVSAGGCKQKGKCICVSNQEILQCSPNNNAGKTTDLDEREEFYNKFYKDKDKTEMSPIIRRDN